MKQKLQKYLDDCIKLRIPPSFQTEPQYTRRIFIGMNKKKKVHRVVRHTFFL